jgi:hypothetical protein
MRPAVIRGHIQYQQQHIERLRLLSLGAISCITVLTAYMTRLLPRRFLTGAFK